MELRCRAMPDVQKDTGGRNMRWIKIKEEKNIAGFLIKTVKCSNCGHQETIHPAGQYPRRCYVCGEQETENE